ncbi:MAG TPA: hypothetical protein DDZ80_32160 [Cyanobacteria bacterium UBA8803]|nr:hypothetical protein [Cyanobacteria bacterium UBA9273]HBL62860.1 hypothetical protein [Cyanobacteria bacterium UBA8803]
MEPPGGPQSKRCGLLFYLQQEFSGANRDYLSEQLVFWLLLFLAHRQFWVGKVVPKCCYNLNPEP